VTFPAKADRIAMRGDTLPAVRELLHIGGMRISAGLALLVVSQLREVGADVEALLGRLGLAEERLQLPEARISHATWIDLLEAGQAVTGDPHFGLHAATRLGPGLMHLLGHLASSEKTAGEALSVAARYLRVLHEGITLALDRQGEFASCRLVTAPGLRLPPIATEFMLAQWISYGRKVIGDVEHELSEVRFAHPASAGLDEYQRHFRARVVFNAQCDELIFPAWNLELPTTNADPVLAAVLSEKVERLLAQFADRPSLASQAREWLVKQLQGGSPRIEALARHLHMSERTLRRRLGEEGTSFKQILDELRRELAIGYVQERQLSTGEIAFLLRYSEPSAFQRAFKRWTKLTPSEFRGQG
jgi:AraC-like DNA-binding protein